MLWWLITVLLVADAWKLSRKLRALAVLAPSAEPPDPAHRFYALPTAILDDATRRAASAHLRRTGLRAVDLWPGDLGAPTVLGLLARIDPATWRHERLARTQGPGQAVVVHAEVIARMGEPEPPQTPLDVQRIAQRARLYATPDTDIAVAPGLRAVDASTAERRALFAEAHGHRTAGLLIVQAIVLALLGAGPFVAGTAGIAAFVMFHVQVPLAFAEGPFTFGAWATFAPLRWPWEAARWVAAAPGPWPSRRGAVEALRPTYDALLAGGTARFHHPPRADCPACGAPDPQPFVSVPDLHQNKPGRFTVARCAACDHFFANPAPTDEGLGFYYRDYYDGPLARDAEDVMHAMTVDYHARARAIAARCAPARWLDVGTGQAHFACAAKDIVPACEFDGLDWSIGVEEAARRGWIVNAYRGTFVDLAATTELKWDVVSMSHYLEHSRDPRAELRAAARVLPEGGRLFIEIPSSESRLGRALGWTWVHWSQPQHLHLPPVAVLTRWLAEAGFDAEVIDRVTPHHPVDLLLAVELVGRRIAPDPDVPWRPPAGMIARLWHASVGLAIVPALIAAGTVDALLVPLLRAKGWTNGIAIVARRRAG